MQKRAQTLSQNKGGKSSTAESRHTKRHKSKGIIFVVVLWWIGLFFWGGGFYWRGGVFVPYVHQRCAGGGAGGGEGGWAVCVFFAVWAKHGMAVRWGFYRVGCHCTSAVRCICPCLRVFICDTGVCVWCVVSCFFSLTQQTKTPGKTTKVRRPFCQPNVWKGHRPLHPTHTPSREGEGSARSREMSKGCGVAAGGRREAALSAFA